MLCLESSLVTVIVQEKFLPLTVVNISYFDNVMRCRPKH